MWLFRMFPDVAQRFCSFLFYVSHFFSLFFLRFCLCLAVNLFNKWPDCIIIVQPVKKKSHRMQRRDRQHLNWLFHTDVHTAVHSCSYWVCILSFMNHCVLVADLFSDCLQASRSVNWWRMVLSSASLLRSTPAHAAARTHWHAAREDTWESVS